jgi:hypothetical protein
MSRNPRVKRIVSWTSRWAARAIVLAVLSTQQGWAAIACQCEPRPDTKPAAATSHCGHGEATETEQAAPAKSNEAAGLHGTHNRPAAQHSVVLASTREAGQPVQHTISCCCLSLASDPATPAASSSTQQSIAVEDAPAVVVSPAMSMTASVSIHGPPRSAPSRPLYIVQSSLLI